MKKELDTQEIVKNTKEKRNRYFMEVISDIFLGLYLLSLSLVICGKESVYNLSTDFKVFFGVAIFLIVVFYIQTFSILKDVFKFSKIIKKLSNGEYQLEKDYVHKTYIKDKLMYAQLESLNEVRIQDENIFNKLQYGSICYRLKCDYDYSPTFFALEYDLSEECKEKIIKYIINYKASNKELP